MVQVGFFVRRAASVIRRSTADGRRTRITDLVIELGLDLLGPGANQVVALNFVQHFDATFHGRMLQ